MKYQTLLKTSTVALIAALSGVISCERVPPQVAVGRYWATLTPSGQASQPLSIYFEYKPRSVPSWDFVPKTAERQVAAGGDLSSASAWLYGLAPATTYDYRFCFKADGSAAVCDTSEPPFSFTTAAATTLKQVSLDPANAKQLVDEDGRRFVPWGSYFVGVPAAPVNRQMVENQMYDQAGLSRIEADFARLSQLAPGAAANTIRMHLQLHEFLIDPKTPKAEALVRLACVIEMAEDKGLHVVLTGLNYFYPGDNPPWISRQTEAQHWDTQALWWNAVSTALRHSPAIFAYDLVNEPYVGSAALVVNGVARWAGASVAPNAFCEYGANPTTGAHGTCFGQFISLDPQGRSTDEIAANWTARMVHAIRFSGYFQNDTDHLITIGVGAFGMSNPFHRSAGVREQLSFLSPHLYGKAADSGQSEIDLARSLSELSGKPVVAGEMFPLGGVPATERVMSQTCNDQTAQGWIGQYDGRKLGDPCQSSRPPEHCMLFDEWYALQGKWGPTVRSGRCLPRIP